MKLFFRMLSKMRPEVTPNTNLPAVVNTVLKSPEIKIVSKMDDFIRLPLDDSIFVREHTLPYSAKYGKQLYTGRMSPCHGVALIGNGEEAFLTHIFPYERQNPKEVIARVLDDAVQRLRKGQSEVTALITGGNPRFEASTPSRNFLKELLEKMKVPFSSVSGNKAYEVRTDMFVSAPERQFVINTNSDPIRSIVGLKDAYDEVIIHPKSSLTFS